MIGAVTLAEAVPAGRTASLKSPRFTVAEPGSTWRKRVAWAPGSGDQGVVLAEGWFRAVNEKTVWQSPPPDEPELPRTGAETRLITGAAAAVLVLGAALARTRLWAETVPVWCRLFCVTVAHLGDGSMAL